MNNPEPANDKKPPYVSMHVESIFGHIQRLPLVCVTFADPNQKIKIQLSPEQARAFAGQILEASGAAETDAVLMRLLTGSVGLDVAQAAGVLQDMRKERDAMKLEQATGRKPGEGSGAN